MAKYTLRRLLHGLVSVVIVVVIVMLLIYSLLDKELIFSGDSYFNSNKIKNNTKEVYKYQKWQEYGYIYYIEYSNYIATLKTNNEISEEDYAKAKTISGKPFDETTLIATNENETTAQYVTQFKELYEKQGYTVKRLKGVYRTASKYDDGGQPAMFAYKPIPLIVRVGQFFGNLISVDNIHYAKGIEDSKRGIQFTFHDPAYGGAFVPAIMGYGTKHRYLLYFDDSFPFIHQNLVKIRLGKPYSLNSDDVWDYMNNTEGASDVKKVIYPKGEFETSDDIHSLTYLQGSYNETDPIISSRFVDDYTRVETAKTGITRMGYSFVIGLISTIIAYVIAVPLGVHLARKKDKFADKLGAIYIIFIMAVPSLAYIYIFREIGGSIFKLPTFFYTDAQHQQQYGWLVYVLPIVSLALPSIAGLMKWMRRYMIDQMNSDYVKFARSGGLSEREIFSKHIMKNAMIYILHGVPGSILGSLVGAVITESIYSVPGVGNILTKAIQRYDNSVIVGITLFYALLSVVSIILGDILMALVDPRISFSSKGGR